MVEATKPSLPSCVINCVVYDKDGKRHDITLDAISDALAQDDGSFVWVGLYEPADVILGVTALSPGYLIEVDAFAVVDG